MRMAVLRCLQLQMSAAMSSSPVSCSQACHPRSGNVTASSAKAVSSAKPFKPCWLLHSLSVCSQGRPAFFLTLLAVNFACLLQQQCLGQRLLHLPQAPSFKNVLPILCLESTILIRSQRPVPVRVQVLETGTLLLHRLRVYELATRFLVAGAQLLEVHQADDQGLVPMKETSAMISEASSALISLAEVLAEPWDSRQASQAAADRRDGARKGLSSVCERTWRLMCYRARPRVSPHADIATRDMGTAPRLCQSGRRSAGRSAREVRSIQRLLGRLRASRRT